MAKKKTDGARVPNAADVAAMPGTDPLLAAVIPMLTVWTAVLATSRAGRKHRDGYYVATKSAVVRADGSPAKSELALAGMIVPNDVLAAILNAAGPRVIEAIETLKRGREMMSEGPRVALDATEGGAKQ